MKVIKSIIQFIKDYWDVFRIGGVNIPIQGYELVINTGNNSPVAVPQPWYGMHETPIMEHEISDLLAKGHIQADKYSHWESRITLDPKPHQTSVTDISNYECRFCINYILLNRVTQPSEYPIPRCDDALIYGFGDAHLFVLLDAFAGYWQELITMLR